MLLKHFELFVFAHAQQRSKRKRISVSNEILDQSRAATCAGDNCLTEILTKLAAKTKNGAPLKVGVVGKYNKARSCQLTVPIILTV